jgi:hypothetical protein
MHFVWLNQVFKVWRWICGHFVGQMGKDKPSEASMVEEADKSVIKI